MAECLSPYILREPEGQPVPCGKCYNCVMRRASAWSFRLMKEEQRSGNALFLTLTYDNKNIPYCRSGMTLVKDHVQLYMKRLRKAHSSLKYIRKAWQDGGHMLKPIRYFTVGEYGSLYWRPHYHQIIFNCAPELVQDAWKYGSVHYGLVSGASVGYCLKYLSKAHRVPKYDGDVRQPEFALMSKRLGSNYVTPAMVNWHKEDLLERMYCVIEGGKKISMCRYYKDKIYTPEERELVAFYSHKLGVDKMREFQAKMMMKYGDLWEAKFNEYIVMLAAKLKKYGSKDKTF